MTPYQITEKLEKVLGPAESYPDRNNNVLFHCPSCNHPKPHLSIQLNTGYYHCWVCDFGGRGISSCLKKLGFYREATEFSGTIDLYTNEFSEAYIANLLGKTRHIEGKKEPLTLDGYERIYKYFYHKSYRSVIEYLFDRDITIVDLIKYDIHYSTERNRVLFPSYDNNLRLNYYVSRKISENDYGLKYENPPIPKTEFVFNEFMIDWEEPLYLTEGIFDCISIRKNATPILGSSLKRQSKLAKEILKNRTPIILILDPDAKTKQDRIAEFLVKNDINVEYVDLSSQNKDISELHGKVELFDKKRFDFFDNIKGRLKNRDWRNNKIC